MSVLKEKILLGIFKEFAAWIPVDSACGAGCAVCCTQNVIITAVEGDLIHRFIREQGREKWLAEKLKKRGGTKKVQVTTNGFASACLRGEELIAGAYGNSEPCPFLEADCCSIYEARPFSCRCFISSERCMPSKPALVDDSYLAASSAVMQIIEHLGQGEYLGNMLDVVSALCDLPENYKYEELLPASFADQARVNVTKALPLPGFLLMEEDMNMAAPLLEAIFSHEVDDRTIEDILNNR